MTTHTATINGLRRRPFLTSAGSYPPTNPLAKPPLTRLISSSSLQGVRGYKDSANIHKPESFEQTPISVHTRTESSDNLLVRVHTDSAHNHLLQHLANKADTSFTHTIDASAHNPTSLLSAITKALDARTSIPKGRIPLYIVNILSPYNLLLSEPFLSTRVSHCNYQSASRALCIYCMPPTPVHDAVGKWASRSLNRVMNSVLTEQETMHVYAAQGRSKLPQGIYKKQDSDPLFHPGMDDRRTKRSKPEADIKTADMSYWLHGKPLPTVVFEVGFTESQVDLVHDAEQWLVKGDSRIKAVILVKIQEGCTTGSAANHIRIMKRVALEQDLAKRAIAVDLSYGESDDGNRLSSPPEYPEDLEYSMGSIDWPTYFATPLTVSLEVWRYDPRTRSAYQEGATHRVYPVAGSNPTLSVDKDLLGLNITQETTVAADRQLELDLKLLQQHVEDGLCEYAVERKNNIEKYVKAELKYRQRDESD